MEPILWHYSTTDGKKYIVKSTGPNTGDTETEEINEYEQIIKN